MVWGTAYGVALVVVLLSIIGDIRRVGGVAPGGAGRRRTTLVFGALIARVAVAVGGALAGFAATVGVLIGGTLVLALLATCVAVGIG